MTFTIENEPEFAQAYSELLFTLEGSTLFSKRPELRKAVDVIAVPERVVMFRVPWEDDNGELQVNRGFRVQFNSALGPYKGGLRFDPSVNLSVLKFLGFEQTFKNALTGLNMGGGKGGSDFTPKGRSHGEIRRFCQSFMTELHRHIGPDTDVPAGDINVTGLEIGYLFGQYKRLRNSFQGVLTGKGLDWGGSLIRPEATGYGVVYYVEKMIERATQGSETIKGKTVLISGSGNVAQYAALKCIELGAHVLSLSDSTGAFIAKSPTDGFTVEQVEKIAALKGDRGYLKSVATEFPNVEFHAGQRPWTLTDKIDIALPCATQNEVSGPEAEHLVKAGCRYVAEGSNMGSTLEAIRVYEISRATADAGLWYGPAKAANCGGVAVSGLEMAQNSSREMWTSEEVDRRLKGIMNTCFDICYNTSVEYTATKERLPSLVRGANVAGFVKVVDAMIAQGEFY